MAIAKPKQAYDVIIVGAGPAAIFAALELTSADAGLRVLMVEKGRDMAHRSCPMAEKGIDCVSCAECSIVSGWGGAGAFSDGKLTLTADVGGNLHRFVPPADLDELIDHVDRVYLRFGASRKVYSADEATTAEIKALAARNDLEYIPARVRHIGTDRCFKLLTRMQNHLMKRLDVIFGVGVADLTVARNGKGRKVKGVTLTDGRAFTAPYVIMAPGREGSKWLEGLTRRLRLDTLKNPVDVGVRVELPAAVMEHLTNVTYEPKLVYNSRTFDDRVRTFCVNPNGFVVKEYLKDVWTVNGHSFKDKKSDNTNFALLVSSQFTEPFKEPISYGRYIAELANFLGQGVIVQRLGDLRAGRRSTAARIAKGLVRPTLKDATPGDLSFVIPYRFMTGILEMLDALDRIAPGVASRHTLLYGMEVKFYSMQLKVQPSMLTEIAGLYAVGDGAGVSRGLIQASASGVLAARSILGSR
jgi:hypothetical protein